MGLCEQLVAAEPFAPPRSEQHADNPRRVRAHRSAATLAAKATSVTS
jgi:hypothetical protein